MIKNKINILSNELDQAPKTRAAGYKENVLMTLQPEIEERMNMKNASLSEFSWAFNNGINGADKWKID